VSAFFLMLARSMRDSALEDAQRWKVNHQSQQSRAHVVLGYSSWGYYFTAEFGQSGRRGEQLLDAARVQRVIEAQVPSAKNSSLNQSQARVLKPLIEEPEALRHVLEETEAEEGLDNTTAAKLKGGSSKSANPNPRRYRGAEERRSPPPVLRRPGCLGGPRGGRLLGAGS
jgi:hypothetical protein